MARPPHHTSANPTARTSLTLGEAADRVALNLLPMGPRLAMLGGHTVLKTYAPDIPKPPLGVQFTPVVGPLWQGAEYLQDGKYLGAGLNGGLAALDGLSGGAAGAGLRTALKVGEKLAGKTLTARHAQIAARKAAEVTGRGWEAHHTIPLDGVARNVIDWRNHPAFMKVLPTATHRRLHGSYQGKPRLGPLAGAWYGRTNWMKAGAAEVGARAADAGEHIANSLETSQPPRKPMGPNR